MIVNKQRKLRYYSAKISGNESLIQSWPLFIFMSVWICLSSSFPIWNTKVFQLLLAFSATFKSVESSLKVDEETFRPPSVQQHIPPSRQSASSTCLFFRSCFGIHQTRWKERGFQRTNKNLCKTSWVFFFHRPFFLQHEKKGK